MMCREVEAAGSDGSTNARCALVKARLMPVTVAGTKTLFTILTGTFVLPIVVAAARMAGVIRTAGTAFVDVTVDCGEPILG